MRKAKAPVPAFCQSGASIGSQFVLIESVSNTPSQTPTLSGLGCWSIPLAVTLTLSALHLVDECSARQKEMAPLKRQRVEVGGVVTVMDAPESDAILGVESICSLVAETFLLLEVAVEGRPLEAVEVTIEEGRPEKAEVVSSSTEGK